MPPVTEEETPLPARRASLALACAALLGLALLPGCEGVMPVGVLGTSTLRSAFEVGIFFILFLGLFWFMRGTRGENILKSTALILLVTFFLLLWLAKVLDLEHLNTLLERVLSTSIIGLIVIFQPELRRGLVRLGENPFFKLFIRSEVNVIDELVDVVLRLAKKKVGALIAIERDQSLQQYMESATRIDAEVSAELIDTIFYPGSALHDGAVIIRNQRVAAAGCLFPLTDNPSISKALGTRHRAAIGLTDETDAVTLVVSEETGQVSIGVDGELHRNLDRDQLHALLRRLVVKGEATAEPGGLTGPREATETR
jgi:diadenylate cyclase